MASPGWYPDPAGQPGAFRFWDGGAWSAELTDNPSAPPPGQAPAPPAYPAQPAPPAQPTETAQGFQSYAASGAVPPPPPDAGGWGATPQPTPQQPWSPESSSGSGRGVVLVLVAVVAVIALAVATFFVVEALTDDSSSTSSRSSRTPSATVTDPATEPSTEPSTAPSTEPDPGTGTQPESPSADPTTPSPTGLQCTGGLPTQDTLPVEGGVMTGGGLQMPTVKGFEVDPAQGAAYVFADGAVVAGKVIEQVDTRGWVAQHVLAGLNRANGFDTPQQAAETVLTCMTSSDDFYASYTGTELVGSAATTVGGADAWRLTADVSIDDPELSVTGDVVTIVVVDTGDAATFGIYVSVVPIGDDALIAQQDAQVGKLALE